MQSLVDLALPELAISEPGFEADPAGRFAASRTQHPWLARAALGYVVTEFGAAKDLLELDEHLRIAVDEVVAFMGAESSPWGLWMKRLMIAQAGEAHRRLRDVLAPMFTPRAANSHRKYMRRAISELLDDWAPRRRIDFEEFASNLPIAVMCGVIGVSPQVLPRLRSSLDTLGLGYNMIPTILPQLEQAYREMQELVVQLVAARRSGERLHADDDVLDALLASADVGMLSSEEVSDLLIFLFGAGYDTSKSVLTLLMQQLCGRPEIYARCAADRPYCAKVVEEGLRYTSPSTIPRRVRQDISYRDVLIPADTMVFIPVSILGRDAGSFRDPDVFDPARRRANRHVAFGGGMHHCLGEFIARVQLQEALHLIAQRMTQPVTTGPLGWRTFTGVWGIRGLPVAFEPAMPQVLEFACAWGWLSTR